TIHEDAERADRAVRGGYEACRHFIDAAVRLVLDAGAERLRTVAQCLQAQRLIGGCVVAIEQPDFHGSCLCMHGEGQRSEVTQRHPGESWKRFTTAKLVIQ